jgi:replicative DNA helicase
MIQALEGGIGSGFDRLPPSDIDAERCLLASMMLDKEMIGQAVQLIDRDSFYQADHQIIYDALVRLYEQNRPVDAVILREDLAKRAQLDSVGGTAYLGQILATVPSSAHGPHYAQIVREKHLLRRLISASNDTLRDAYGRHESAEIVVDRAEKRVFEIAEKKVKGAALHIGEIASEVYQMLEDRGRRGLMTGFHKLDEMLNGLQKGEMVILAARPSMGKTALAMNIVENIAIGVAGEGVVPCAVFSLEMSRQQLAQRMLCSLAEINGHKVRTGMMGNDEYVKMAQVVAQLSKVPIFVDDSPQLTILDLRAKARRLKLHHDIQMIMIDYMQLMDNPGVESRQQQISEISRGVKAVARELEVPVVCLSQLNRASEARDGHRPRMSDLRESGSIEQDADVVMLIHREDYYHLGEQNYNPTNETEIIIAKQRNGPTGTVKLLFDNATTKFKNLAQGAEYD